jgi:hypothetical protein
MGADEVAWTTATVGTAGASNTPCECIEAVSSAAAMSSKRVSPWKASLSFPCKRQVMLCRV